MLCLLQVNRGLWCQETYDAASGDAAQRAEQLRQAGYEIRERPIQAPLACAKGRTVTILHIGPGTHADTYGLPDVPLAEWRRGA
jgi:hypothetical protein